jgi:TRAP-type C4-dicarboxylate transport system permease large subunit
MTYILWFVLGCIVDPGSMIFLTLPFLYQPLVNFGFNPIWLGVVSTLMTEVGMITPPVGMNLFVLRASTKVEMKYIIKGSIPYVVTLLLGLVILTIFPGIALFIPNQM